MMDAQTRELQVGAGTKGGLNKSGQDLCSVDRQSMAKGCRDKGGGRIDHFVSYKVMLKNWVEVERSNGHSLDMTDLMVQWMWFAEETKKLLEAREKELQTKDRILEEFHWDWLGEIIKIGARRPRTSIFDSGFGSTRRAVRFHPNRSSGDRFYSKLCSCCCCGCCC